MARQKLARSLPKLPNLKGLKGFANKGQRLLEMMRLAAVAAQKEQPNIFYSMREVARHFKLPLGTVSKVYRMLEDEGILSAVRGSKTMLLGREYDRKLHVRAFVGLPVSLSRFITLQDYRMFFVKTRRELRLRRFVAAMLFLDQDAGEHFIKRLRQYEVDTIVWLTPEPQVRQVALALKDAGIRLIGVSDGGLPSITCRYEISRENAFIDILRDWRNAGVNEGPVIVVTSKIRSTAADEQRVHNILSAELMDHKFISWGDEPIEALLQSAQRENARGIVLLSPASSFFSFRAPVKLTQLLNSFRVAFLDGPVNMPFARVPSVLVDIVHVNWQHVAETIVSDLITQSAFDPKTSRTFHAEAKLRVPLSDFAQAL